jgi:hypothetical protein
MVAGEAPIGILRDHEAGERTRGAHGQRLHHRAENTAERPGQPARHEQRGVAGRQPAGQRRQHKQRKQDEHQPLAFEAVDEAGRRHAGGTETVGGDQQAELPRVDTQPLHQEGVERHRHHEIDDVAELNGGQREQETALAFG